MKLNPTAEDRRINRDAPRLAGGYGPFPAREDAEAQLWRVTQAALLGEDLFYADGKTVAAWMSELVPQVAPATVARIAVAARHEQGLRHTPLYLVYQMTKHASHRPYVADTLAAVATRPDMLTDYAAIYWRDGDLTNGPQRRPLSAASKRGLAAAFARFDAFQLGRYRGDDQAVKLVDVMRLVHPKPTQTQEAAFKALRDGSLRAPDTWERALSEDAGKDKRATWTRLLTENRVAGLALLRNLRNIEQAGVEPAVVRSALAQVRGKYLLPLHFWAAWKAAPRYAGEIEAAMLRHYAGLPKLPGVTAFILDTSGSMRGHVSAKSDLTRQDAGLALMVLAAEQAETPVLYVTSGSDARRQHATARLKGYRGFALAEQAQSVSQGLGGGGIFTRQVLEYVKADMRETPDRVVVFSDSQDCDDPTRRVPAPFGRANYVIDVSAHRYGVGYRGLWTAEVSGWSQHFLTFIAGLEGLNVAGMTGGDEAQATE